MMSSLDQRILFYRASNQSWTDHTIALNDPGNGLTAAFSMLPGDYVYISSFLPFNHKFFKVTTVAAITRAPYIEVCDLSSWYPVVDTMDHTSNMRNSGNLVFTRDPDKGWTRVQNSKRDITALSTAPATIHDSHWMRLSFPTSDPSPTPITFTLEYIGQCFSTDSDLYAEYPALRASGLLSSWKQGKTDWNDQHTLAASYIAKTLRQRGIIENRDQILDIATLVSPAVHKVANVIFSGLGAKNYEKEIQATAAAFDKAMTQGMFQVDADKDGIKGIEDRRTTTRRATR